MKYDPLGRSQCRERARESFEMIKNISRKNDKIWSKIIFHQRTVRETCPDIFYEILVINFRLVVLIFFGTFRAKLKCGSKIFLTKWMYNSPGTLAGPFRDLPEILNPSPFLIARFLLLIIFGIFRAKVKKL